MGYAFIGYGPCGFGFIGIITRWVGDCLEGDSVDLGCNGVVIHWSRVLLDWGLAVFGIEWIGGGLDWGLTDWGVHGLGTHCTGDSLDLGL